MIQRDENGCRIKWNRAEKKMVRAIKSAGLKPCRPIFSYRSKSERLGKTAMKDLAEDNAPLPPHLVKGPQRTPKVRSVIVVPTYDDFDAGPSNLCANLVEDSEAGPSNLCNEPIKDEPVLNDEPTLEDENPGIEPFEEVELEGWPPTFYPVYEEPSFPLPDLSVEVCSSLVRRHVAQGAG